MKRKPDLLLVLMAILGLGVLATVVTPATSSKTVAAPASELQAGVIIKK